MRGPTYTELRRQLRQLPAPGHGEEKRALVQAATLAASSHNTQPWSFRLASDHITIEPDFARRCGVVDPDDSHLFKSLGCAAENIVAAAPAYGFAADVRVANDGCIDIGLARLSASSDSGSLKAIAERQCTKTPYDGRPLQAAENAALESAGNGGGVSVKFIDDAALKESILELVNEGNQAQLSDPAFRRELIAWIRFNDAKRPFGQGTGSPAESVGNRNCRPGSPSP